MYVFGVFKYFFQSGKRISFIITVTLYEEVKYVKTLNMLGPTRGTLIFYVIIYTAT